VYAPLTVGAKDPLPTVPRPGAWAVIVAGGNGTRFGRRKQFADLGGQPVLAWSLDVASQACAGVVVVLPDRFEDDEDEPRLQRLIDRADKVVIGGVLRSDSVRAGVDAVPDDAAIIAVHDAARPLAGLPIWLAVLDAVAGGADGAIPVVTVVDTVTRVHPDGTRSPVDRSSLRAVQTPQGFRAQVLRLAHQAGNDATDDATLVEAVGGRVVLVDGHPGNLKITTAGDLKVAGALLADVHPR
jgi:2-C-methyl-D-erythritol 4-phosphate cytidylyltransferase